MSAPKPSPAQLRVLRAIPMWGRRDIDRAFWHVVDAELLWSCIRAGLVFVTAGRRPKLGWPHRAAVALTDAGRASRAAAKEAAK